MKIASRNVNGIRAVLKKDFFPRVKATNADIFCFQEVKAFESQIPAEIRFHLADYQYVRHHGSRPGYAGTALFFRKDMNITEKKAEFSDLMFREDGRMTQLNFWYQNKEIALLNLYFPNGNPRADGTEMLPYKLAFYEKYRAYMHSLRAEGKRVISTGDFNICHKEIDIARPEANKDSIGFLPIERAEMDTLVAEHYHDVFRTLHPTAKDSYTRRSYRSGARERNVGWRLDYFWVDEAVLPWIATIEHQETVEGSDHCPIILELK
ncbi:MAG: exodeoxyribonuclease III [Candidatus Peribacteria bacterium]|jgi:exodeoxyribonuclease-3|nr:exodeoxyribonuclease III [Candidatus Peribacteria bacterium]